MNEFLASSYDTEIIFATTQRAAVADALTCSGIMWSWALTNITKKGHGNPKDQLDAVHTITQDFHQPLLMFCQPDAIDGLDDQGLVRFSITSRISSVDAECKRIR